MKQKLLFIAMKIVERLEHEATHAKMLHCTEVGLVICDYYADTSSSIKQYILETTWKDFFEDTWENRKGAHILYSDEMERFVEDFSCVARSYVVDLIPYITTELFCADFEDFECKITDRDDGVLFIKAKVK